MEITVNLEKWLRIKLDSREENLIYDISTEEVRSWIDIYNDLIKRGYTITQNLENENR
jgi:predicted nucleic acid-binding protein